MLNSDSFILYRLPSESNIHFINGEAKPFKSITDLSEAGFIMSPFTSKTNDLSYFFRSDQVLKIKMNELDNLGLSFNNLNNSRINQTKKEEHRNIIEMFFEENEIDSLKKVVVSRIKSIKRNEESPLKLFEKLCNAYPSAFVYLCRLPNNELWCGATPETLASYTNGELKTMALAGTQLIEENKLENVVWEKKEKDEQIWVQKYIEELFISHKIDYKKLPTKTIRAGHICHIQTAFKAKVDSRKAQLLCHELHPTPAVCGTPMQLAKDFIIANEPHSRGYYSGYLGYFSPEKFDLFVNLRCMRIEKDYYQLYIGGGITAESNANDEWIETENKAQVLESAIIDSNK